MRFPFQVDFFETTGRAIAHLTLEHCGNNQKGRRWLLGVECGL